MFKENKRLRKLRIISSSSSTLMKKQNKISSKSLLLSSLTSSSNNAKILKKAVGKSLDNGINRLRKSSNKKSQEKNASIEPSALSIYSLYSSDSNNITTRESTKELYFVNDKIKIIFHFNQDSKWTLEIIDDHNNAPKHALEKKLFQLPNSKKLRKNISSKFVKKVIKKGLSSSSAQSHKNDTKTIGIDSKEFNAHNSSSTSNGDNDSKNFEEADDVTMMTNSETQKNNVSEDTTDIVKKEEAANKSNANCIDNHVLSQKQVEEDDDSDDNDAITCEKSISLEDNDDDINWIILGQDNKNEKYSCCVFAFFHVFQKKQ